MSDPEPSNSNNSRRKRRHPQNQQQQNSSPAPVVECLSASSSTSNLSSAAAILTTSISTPIVGDFGGASSGIGDDNSVIITGGGSKNSTTTSTRNNNNNNNDPELKMATNNGATVDFFTKELQCLVCLQLMEEPYATACSHTFCRQCIERSLQHKKRCPKCNYALERPEQIFPNETLSNLVQRCVETQFQIKRMRMEVPSCGNQSSINIVKSLSDPSWDLPSVVHMIELLQQKRVQLEQSDQTLRDKLLREFLEEMIVRRNQKVEKITREVRYMEHDLKFMQATPQPSESSVVPSPTENALMQPFDIESRSNDAPSTSYKSASGGQSLSSMTSPSTIASTLLHRRRRMRLHFDDLEQSYLNARMSNDFSTRNSSMDTGEHLDRFADCLTKLTQYTGFRQLATLSYNIDLHSGLNIVSSIEFDRDGEYFAIAGVTKKIKLYDYNSVLQDAVDIHYPIAEIQCGSKISCVSWNPYSKGILASSDYEGIVQLWDVMANKSIKKFKEHEKRCWSVAFNQMDTRIMASASDDAKVKLWSTDSDHSIGTLEAKVNVCCVQFNPTSRYHLAFGSADHCVHYYDLRNPKYPSVICKGHKKAVSYVKFVNSQELVSASTDSQLRLWTVDNGQCSRTLKGHQNEKNFVGLATDGDYISCGSENNNLYVYYKELSKPILIYSFGGDQISMDRDRVDSDAGGDFVSAVCWKKNTNVILAANSQGTIKVLELI